MAELDGLRQALIDAKLAGTKMGLTFKDGSQAAYVYRTNEQAAEQAMRIVEKWLAERDASANTTPDPTPTDPHPLDGDSYVVPSPFWPESTQ